MIHFLNINDAMDIIDGWGPDPVLWPSKHRGTLEAMIRDDDEFAAYVADVKRIEDLLNNWEEDADGAEIDWDEIEDEENQADYEPPKEQPKRDDLPEDDASDPQFPGVDFGQDDEQEDEDDEDAGDLPMPNFGDQADVAEDAEPIELDTEGMQDVDEMFQDFIRSQIQSMATDEFRVFTRDFDEIVDLKVPDSTPLDQIDQAVAKSTGALQKDLRRMIAAQSQSKRIPGKRSGRLHAPNLHRILSGDDRVFTRREEAPTLDTAISLVMDNSGSMQGSRLKLAAETAYAIGSVLSRLGVTFECLGFTCNSSDPRAQTAQYRQEVSEAHAIAPITRSTPIIMPKFKTFEERWLPPVQRRFAHVYNYNGGYAPGGGGVVPFGSTPEGCGVEFAARRLLQRKEKRKIMIVMTDGEPAGETYGGYRSDRPYVAQAAQVVRSVAASGIDLVGIGIQHSGPNRYYPNSMVINDLSEMPKQLMDLLKRFMLGK